MAHSYEELKKKTVAELRDLAKETQHEAVQGYTQMNKEHLLPALCKALGIDAHEHHAAIAAEKGAIKAKMRELKAACEKAKGTGDDEPAPSPASISPSESLASRIGEAGYAALT